MIDLPPFPSYSMRLWDYLGDMPYMPTASDRELLEKKAAANPSHAHRIRIWDYFFTPRPEDVGKPIQRELSELRVQAANQEAEGHQRLQQSRDALARLEQIRSDELSAVEAQLFAIETEMTARERSRARTRLTIGAIVGGGSAVVGFVILVLGIGASSMSLEDGCFAQLGAGCLSAVWVILGIPAIVIGASLAISGSRGLARDRIHAVVAGQQQRVRESWAARELVLNEAIESERTRAAYAQEILDRLVPHLRSRIAFLERSLQNLLLQLPPVPTVDEVESWLTDDIQDLLERGEEQLGVAGRTIHLDGTKNPFLIRSPAEIQDPALIPPTYRGNDPDRKKYLHARRFGKTADGRDVQHYGVFHLELLFITGAVLARYSVFFDFIRGDRIGERAPQQHFADVVLLEMRREYREISIDGRPVVLEQAPSMILSLSSGDRIAITVPSPEYFHAVGADGVPGDYDAYRAADSALRAITERVNEAKRNLEVGQLARMKEKETESD